MNAARPLRRIAGAAAAVLVAGAHAMPIDVNSLWNYSDPQASEQRFRDALAGASPDDALILQTQIARTWGLRREFGRAREVLAAVEPAIENASVEARVRFHLELGRTWASTAHKVEELTPEAREDGRRNYMRAFDLAKAAGLDFLAIDALHMMVCVDTAPEEQLAWDLEAIRYMEASSRPEARRWEGSLYNNAGYALQSAGRYEEALVQFRKSLAAHERAGRPANVRIAWWMIARTLRAQGKVDEAIDIQSRLEREWDAEGKPDPYVYEELELLYRDQNNPELAAIYAAKLRNSRGG